MEPSSTVIVVPTYNEADNIASLVSALDHVVARFPLDVLFVDDGSPDGTGGMVVDVAASRPWVHLMTRPSPTGLGSAYRDGFRWALAHGFEFVGEMDADLSHDPAVIPMLYAQARAGAGVALGSRYTRGGGSSGWPMHRRVLSRGANAFARTLLRLEAKDVTSGYRIYARRAIETLIDADVRCDGYGFQVETLAVLAAGGFTITEVPITFRERQRGASKMSIRAVGEAAKRVVVLSARRNRHRRRHGAATTAPGVVAGLERSAR